MQHLIKKLLPRSGPPERWKEVPCCLVAERPYQTLSGTILIAPCVLTPTILDKFSAKPIVVPFNTESAKLLDARGILTHESLFTGLRSFYQHAKPEPIMLVHKGTAGRHKIVFSRLDMNGNPELAEHTFLINDCEPRPYQIKVCKIGHYQRGPVILHVEYDNQKEPTNTHAVNIDHTWDLALTMTIASKLEILSGAKRQFLRPDNTMAFFKTGGLFENKTPTLPGTVHRFADLGHVKPDGTRGELLVFALMEVDFIHL